MEKWEIWFLLRRCSGRCGISSVDAGSPDGYASPAPTLGSLSEIFLSEDAGRWRSGRFGFSWGDVAGDTGSLQEMPHLLMDMHLPPLP